MDEVVLGCEVLALGAFAAARPAEHEEDEGFFVLGRIGIFPFHFSIIVIFWVFRDLWMGILGNF